MAGKDLARTSQTREPGPTIALVMMGVVAAAAACVLYPHVDGTRRLAYA